MYISGQKYVMTFEHICLKQVKNLADDKFKANLTMILRIKSFISSTFLSFLVAMSMIFFVSLFITCSSHCAIKMDFTKLTLKHRLTNLLDSLVLKKLI